MSLESYLASLPEVETMRLPRGTLFVASTNNLIYQVTETNGTFARARQWRRDEKTDVALVPGSYSTKYLPLVPRGRLLPMYRSRNELTVEGRPLCFLFPKELFAMDAAYLDSGLISGSGAYVRVHNQEPAFAVTDGVHIYRLYYYTHSDHGNPTSVQVDPKQPPYELKPYSTGPAYWQLLPGWWHEPQRDDEKIVAPKTSLKDHLKEKPPLPEPPINSQDTIINPRLRRDNPRNPGVG